MCGIVGMVAAQVDPQRRALLPAMLDAIRHRGPDDQGYYCDDRFALGHCRLAIIDLAGARQPMVSPTRDHVIGYNGEIYNYPELRRTLESKGRVFRTNSDTEVLLQWLAEYGEDGLDALNGMFAFAWWRPDRGRLVLARDRLGIKPLYVLRQEGTLYFSSEIKALIPVMRQPAVDPRTVFEYLTLQNIVSERTFFSGVERLMPGELLAWENGSLQRRQYWRITYCPQPMPLSQAAERYGEALDNAVRRHVLSDVPLGAYLSGGFDSASVVCAMARLLPSPPVFTGYFADRPYYDERPGARAVAESVGSPLHEVPITPDAFLRYVEQVVYSLDEPTLGTGALPQYVVAQALSSHVKVVLTGHGGDELFAGYQVFKVALLKEQLRKGWSAGLRTLAAVRRSEWTRVLYYLCYPLLYPEVGHGMFVMVPRRKRLGFFSPDLLSAVGDYDPVAKLARLLDNGEATPGQKLQTLYMRAYLPTLFNQEDRMSMAHSVEARTPLCDNELVALSLELELSAKLSGGELKAVPKAAMRGRLPSLLYDLPKRGFPTPFHLWFRRKPVRELITDVLLDRRTMQRDIFNAKAIQGLLAANERDSVDTLFGYARATTIWSILATELWHRAFIDVSPSGRAPTLPDRLDGHIP